MSEAVPALTTIGSLVAMAMGYPWIAVAIAAAGMGTSYVLADATSSDFDAAAFAAASEARGHLVNISNTQAPLPLIYGTCRVGVNRVFAGVSGDDNKYLHLICTVGEGEVEGIHQEDDTDQLFLNDKLYTEYGDLVTYEFFTGTASQTVCTTLHEAISDWTDPLHYTAYLYIRLEYDYNVFQGLPQITLIVDGLKVYDPATETTVFTTNPALCARDFLVRSSRRGGMAIASSRLLDSTFTSAKSYCTTKGWTVGLPIRENQAAVDNLKQILATYRGAVVYSENRFKAKYRDLNYESPVMDLTEADIVERGESTLTIAQPSLFGTPNAVRVKFLNPDIKYQTDDYVKSDSTAIAADGDLREEEISLLGVGSYANVMKLANYWLERLRVNKEASFEGRARLAALEPFDLIRLTHSLPGWENKMLRVVSPQLTQEGTVAVECEEEDADFYNDTYDMDTHSWHDTTLPSPSDAVPSVINVSHEEEVYYYRGRSFTRWKVDFDAPAASTYPFWDYAEVWVKIGDGDWKFMTKATTDYMIDPVEEGVNYSVRLVSVSIFGTKQAFADGYTVSKTIVGKTAAPSSLTALTAVASDDVVNLYAEPVADPDIDGYEVRLGSAWNGGIFIGFNESPNIRLAGVRPGTHTFWMAAKNNAGLYSETPCSAQVIVFYPANYAQKNAWSWDFTTGEHSNTEHTTYDSEDCLKCSHDATWDLLDDECDDISEWTNGDNNNGVSEDEGGWELLGFESECYRFDANTATSQNYAHRYRDLASAPDQFTLEIRLYHDALGAQSVQDHFYINFQQSTRRFHVNFSTEGCKLWDDSGYIEVGTDLVKSGGNKEYQTWRFVVDMDAGTCDVYLNDSTHTWEKVGAGLACVETVASVGGRVQMLQAGYTTNNMLTHVDYVKIQSGLVTPGQLSGTWTSPEYNLGSKKKVRIWGDFRTTFVASGLTWDGLIPAGTTWNTALPSGMTWTEFFSAVAAGQIAATLKWGDAPGSMTGEADYFHILAPEIEAQYVQVEVTITDPANDAIMYLRELSLKAYFWE